MEHQMDFQDYINQLRNISPLGRGEKFVEGEGPFATVRVYDPATNDSLCITCKTPEEFINGWTRTLHMTRGEQHTWAGKYLFHAEGEPSIKFYDGSEGWFNQGLLHNIDGPALVSKTTSIHFIKGHPIDKSKFNFYVDYHNRVSKTTPPVGLTPTFPLESEIEEAIREGLTVYFDASVNFFWYDRNGQLHHPTQPAVDRVDGVLEYWTHGTKIRESTRTKSTLTKLEIDDIAIAVREALDRGLSKAISPRFTKTSDILNSKYWSSIREIILEADYLLRNGHTMDEAYDHFRSAYGQQKFDDDFSQELQDNFPDVMNEIIQAIEDGAGNISNPINPYNRINSSTANKDIIVKHGVPNDQVNMDAVPDVRNGLDEEVRSKELSDLMKDAEKLLDELDGVGTEEKVPEQEKSNDGWVLPVGALVAAGLVGVLSKKPSLKTITSPAEVMKEVSEAATAKA